MRDVDERVNRQSDNHWHSLIRKTATQRITLGNSKHRSVKHIRTRTQRGILGCGHGSKTNYGHLSCDHRLVLDAANQVATPTCAASFTLMPWFFGTVLILVNGEWSSVNARTFRTLKFVQFVRVVVRTVDVVSAPTATIVVGVVGTDATRQIPPYSGGQGQAGGNDEKSLSEELHDWWSLAGLSCEAAKCQFR